MVDRVELVSVHIFLEEERISVQLGTTKSLRTCGSNKLSRLHLDKWFSTVEFIMLAS